MSSRVRSTVSRVRVLLVATPGLPRLRVCPVLLTVVCIVVLLTLLVCIVALVRIAMIRGRILRTFLETVKLRIALLGRAMMIPLGPSWATSGVRCGVTLSLFRLLAVMTSAVLLRKTLVLVSMTL